MSDKLIVEQSNLLDYLLPGDVIVADRGFTCDKYARMAFAEVKISPFTKGKKQLEKVQLDLNREFSCCAYSCGASNWCFKTEVHYITK